MLDLSRQYAGLREQFLAAVARVCDSQKYILGEEVTSFEREFASLCGSTEAVGCASGTDALWLGLVAAGVKPGDAVITTPFSFFATASSILRAGARPVFADIDPETLNLDPVKVEQGLRAGVAAPACHHACPSLWSVRGHGCAEPDCRRIQTGGGGRCCAGSGRNVEWTSGRSAGCNGCLQLLPHKKSKRIWRCRGAYHQRCEDGRTCAVTAQSRSEAALLSR